MLLGGAVGAVGIECIKGNLIKREYGLCQQIYLFVVSKTANFGRQFI